MSLIRCSALQPTRLAPWLSFSRTYVPRQKAAPLKWWLEFDPQKHGERVYAEYCKTEEKRVESLQKRVEKFRAMRGVSIDKEAVEDVINAYQQPPSNDKSKNWLPPPAVIPQDQGYIVKRTQYGCLPVFMKYKNDRNLAYVIVRRVDGDLWILRQQLMQDLDLQLIQVNELTGFLKIYPDFANRHEAKRAVEDFLYRKGF